MKQKSEVYASSASQLLSLIQEQKKDESGDREPIGIDQFRSSAFQRNPLFKGSAEQQQHPYFKQYE